MELLKRLKPKQVRVSAPAAAHDFFFVRGHPRSGTNWVGALLNLHPNINCWGEFHFEDIRNAIDNLQAQPWQITAREPLKTALDRSFEDMVKKAVLTLESRKPGAYWVGDRTPRGLRVFVEGSPYFLIIRDGRDILVSWTYHVLRMRPHVHDMVSPPSSARRSTGSTSASRQTTAISPGTRTSSSPMRAGSGSSPAAGRAGCGPTWTP